MRRETRKKLDTFGFENPEDFDARKDELRPMVRDSLIVSLLEKEMLEQKEFAYVRRHFEVDWDVSLESKTAKDPYVCARINDRKTISIKVNKAHIEDESNKEILKSLICGLVEPLENSYFTHVMRITPASKSVGKFADKTPDLTSMVEGDPKGKDQANVEKQKKGKRQSKSG